MSDFIELKRLAMEATPGPWEIQVSHYPESGDMIVTTDPNGWELLEIREDCPEHEANAEFIAAANPKTILALIAENERLSEECEGCPMAESARLREERDSQQRVCIKVMEERDQLRAEVEALRSIALELRGWVGCADVNHRAGEFHEYDEPCKVLARIDEVLRND